jgi:NADH-quinone oxidoreductase subunit D
MPYTLKPDQGIDPNADNVKYLDDHVDTGDRWVLNFGPQHPATHTTLRLVLELDGERIARCTPHIGYLHSGFEKLGEHLDYNQYVTIVSRMNYLSPIANDIAWHGAVEKLFGIELTPKCKVLRTIMAEMARIQDHLLCSGAAAIDLGAITSFLYAFNPREKIYDIVDYISGQRFHPDWTRVGGIMKEIPDEEVFKRMVKSFINEDLPQSIKDLEGLVNRNRIFMDRVQGVGVLTREDAIAWSISGPIARASGVRRDLRKDEPYLCYADNWDGQGAEKVKFSVPLAQEGDSYARFLVRLRGDQAVPLDHQPAHRQHPHRPRRRLRRFQGRQAQQEGCLRLHRGPHPALRAHHDQPRLGSRRSPRSTAPTRPPTASWATTSCPTAPSAPWRARTRPPSFINYQIMAKLIEGHLLADIVAVLGSLNVIAAELDR